MTLTDKIIKNTFYTFLAQIVGFLFPIILTPIIIRYIGDKEYGIYVLIMGFIGSFGLFDLSISTSFVKFISEFYNKNDIDKLNKYINTGYFFYLLFSLLAVIVGYLLTKPLISLINIPTELQEKSLYVFRISLLIFFVTTAFSIYVSILTSLQKMYIMNISGLVLGFLNAAAVVVVLMLGFGLEGLIWVQLCLVTISTVINVFYTRKYLPQIKINPSYFSKEPLKEMGRFGLQMQLSKLASFASDKYDEFLLGYFYILNDVTYYNLGARIARLGRFIPFQLVPQLAPAAAELAAKNEVEKLRQLFLDATKFLALLSFPIFLFIFVFSDEIILTWVGSGYEMSGFIIKILVIGQLINMTFSAPGNSIIPNTGVPKYQMFEGIIFLGVNLVLSFILIKNFGITGAAYGNSTAFLIGSFFVFFTALRFFRISKIKIFINNYLKITMISLATAIVSYIINKLIIFHLLTISNRITGLLLLFINGVVFLVLFIFLLKLTKYLDKREIGLMKRFLKIGPLKIFDREI
ncbi:MAG: oligosaccharide flippase family protein [Ignavibacteria bacterium]